MIDVFLFGQIRSIPELQNDVFDLMFEKQKDKTVIPMSDFRHVHENTNQGSPLRRYFVDLIAHGASLDDPVWFAGNVKAEYPTD